MRDERVRRLRAQLPEAAFPATVRTLPALLLVLFLALAAATAVLLDDREGQAVPGAFLESQRELAASVARSVGATANQSLSDLRAASAGAAPEAVDPMLDALVRSRKWRGAAVFAGSSRTLVATRGEPVPAQAIPASVNGAAVTSMSAANGELVLITTTELPGGRLLAATTAVRLPEAEADELLRQSFVLTTLSGKVVGATASPAQDRDTRIAALVADAGRAAGGGTPGVRLGPAEDRTQPTLAYARVTPSSTPDGLDLAVVAVADGPLSGSDAEGSGLVPAAILAALAVVGFVLVKRVVTRPVLAARADLLGVAAGNLDTEIRSSSTGEVARIVAAARMCRDRLVGDDDHDDDRDDTAPQRRRVITARVTSGVVALAVFGWSAGMLVAFRTTEVEIHPAVVASVRTQTGKATDALRRSMNDGLADLAAVAGTTGNDAALRTALEGLLADQTRYRSLYLVDRSGTAGEPVGRPPLRRTEAPAATAGFRQHNQVGRVPVILAEVPVPGRGTTLVGEFDLDHIRVLLDQVPGHARVVDGDFRTINATDGFVAFEEVTAAGLRDSAARAKLGGAVGEIRQGSDGPAIVASAAVLGGEVERLGWTVVTELPGGELALPVNQTRRHAQLVALIGALVALFGYGWLLFTVLGPLRRVARAADLLVAGDLRSVIYPQRHDEIGTIASCLEICRQAVVQGPDRLGEVRRPRGAATDPTLLMKPVERPAPTTRSPRRRAPERPRPKVGRGSA
ncbi:HAMP domain-containing protein [Saccharothrix deserti]|uniref:HAMP domain-containing protein n=1 Tax=Saccharothrix deserti TaxID=2593674 RepID=UPI00131A6F3D|nr:HAMP domain-containing protein [Saccharothrix deserti]